ncbi:MAG TPA: NAD(P)/FAD-dependent oxidoreductase, partial [Thermoanaerobaculia bacterium]|nr:NAD(P)/FAD-dependent oxidoreductase [Thermoanaerobaculia bacterium]
MAAIFSAASDTETLLLERTPDGGRKILISGGGRCNVLPTRADAARFMTDSAPRTLVRMLRSWPLREQILFFENELGVPLAAETESGKLFPASNRARDVRDALLALARRRGATLATGALVTNLEPMRGRWRIERDGAPPLEADAVVVATGGLSIPRSGSDGIGLSVLAKLGHTIHTTYAALTPLTAPASPFSDLAGLSLPVTLTARSAERSASSSGGFLFTHRGYSGPSVLDVSHVAVRARDEGDTAPARLTARWTELDEP